MESGETIQDRDETLHCILKRVGTSSTSPAFMDSNARRSLTDSPSNISRRACLERDVTIIGQSLRDAVIRLKAIEAENDYLEKMLAKHERDWQWGVSDDDEEDHWRKDEAYRPK
jgi:hypothetical protein